MTIDLSQLDVFYGELTVNRALVYARLPRIDDSGDWKLSGQVRGPRCLHAQTLPVTAPLVDQEPGPTLLAKALISDPCFWWPDLPAIYDVTVKLHRGTEVVATARHEIGLRALGVRGRNLALNGKQWVLRGVSTASTTERLPRAWHEAAAAYISAGSDPESLAEASQWGTLTVVQIEQHGEEAAHQLRELARYPGVAMAVVSSLPMNFKKSEVAPNLLLAQEIKSSAAMHAEPWADLLVIPANELERSRGAIDNSKPVIAFRRLDSPSSVPDARAACDVLQRDLAPSGQFAGYVV
jgi:hypothetical protein